MKKLLLSTIMTILIPNLLLSAHNLKNTINFIDDNISSSKNSPSSSTFKPKLKHNPTAYNDLTTLEEKFETNFNTYKKVNFDYPQKRIVCIPVADLRFEPESISSKVQLPSSDLTNPLQITQLLLGEYLIAYEESIDNNNESWLKVYAIQQEKFVGPSGWIGYPGWIKKNQTIEVESFPSYNIVVHSMLADIMDINGNIIETVSIGTRFQGAKINDSAWQVSLPNGTIGYISNNNIYEIAPILQESIDDLRQSIINTSKEFLGFWYSWGGRSAQSSLFGNISSVDCSALINLSFLAHGLQLPRMSKEQFLTSHQIYSGADLQPGDLIFYASVFKNRNYKNPLLIDHIMMYLGDNQLIEATFADEHQIRITACDTRIGKPCHEIRSGDIIKYDEEEYFVYFATFFNNQDSLQKLRNNCLEHEYSLS